MNGQRNTLSRIGGGLLALGLLIALPHAADASGLGFQNKTTSRILVQGTTVVNGMVRKGPLLVIEPGKTVWDVNVPAGNRSITVCDGFQPSRILLRETVTVGTRDQFFQVLPPQTGLPRYQLHPQALPGVQPSPRP